MSRLFWLPIPANVSGQPGEPQEMAVVATARVNGGENALLLVGSMVLTEAGVGFPVTLLGLSDGSDQQPMLTGAFDNLYQGSVTRLTIFDDPNEVFNRARALPDNADSQLSTTLNAVLGTVARLQGYHRESDTWNRLGMHGINGNDAFEDVTSAPTALDVIAFNVLHNGFQWVRQLSPLASNMTTDQTPNGSVISLSPVEWSITDAPAAATQATATRAAAAGGCHVLRSINCTLLAVAAQGNIRVVVRDGATGVGPILWEDGFVLGAGSTGRVSISGLNIRGSDATDMTIEFTGAPAATNFAIVNATGYTIPS